MRLISTLEDQKKAYILSTYLMKQGIENQLEIITNTDWGSPDYGNKTCHIWVTDEDQFENALSIANEYLKSPQDPKYDEQTYDSSAFPPKKGLEAPPRMTKPGRVAAPMGLITRYILLICVLLFIISSFTSPTLKSPPPSNIPLTPLLLPPINKTLMFDYPKAYQLIDNLVDTYGLDAVQNPDSLPKTGKQLLIDALHTPYWKGIYPMLVAHVKNPDAPWVMEGPFFEKINEGEVWRLLTPDLLHSDIFHLFFNMIWLVVLGRQMEERMSRSRYILFIVMTGIVSNIAQYMMSGPNFIGFSGILCAMLAFIWVRQKRAAWEGYHLEKGTMAFILFFLLFIFGLQVISFVLEVRSEAPFSIGIANTAHLTGGILGYFLGKINFFSWRKL